MAFARILRVNGSPNSEMFAGEIGKRNDVSDKVMTAVHKVHAPGKHWYVYMAATSPAMQGKGYGKQLFNFLEQLAMSDDCDTYLECVGERNSGFYAKFGFEVRESVYLSATWTDPAKAAKKKKKKGGAAVSDVEEVNCKDEKGEWKRGPEFMNVMVRPAGPRK